MAGSSASAIPAVPMPVKFTGKGNDNGGALVSAPGFRFTLENLNAASTASTADKQATDTHGNANSAGKLPIGHPIVKASIAGPSKPPATISQRPAEWEEPEEDIWSEEDDEVEEEENIPVIASKDELSKRKYVSTPSNKHSV